MGARTWSEFRARGEHGDVFPVFQLRCARILIAYLFKGSQEQSFFRSDTLIYGIPRDGSKNVNIRTCEHVILGQLRMGARQTKNAPLTSKRSVGIPGW